MLIDIDAPLAIDAPRRQEISVRRVRSLLAVVTHNSFSKAAQELGLTQPAVTQHVQQLERQLGVSLLTRDPTGFRLSPAGAALLPAFRRLMSSNGAILDQLNSLSQGTSQILRVASPASFAALHIAPAFQQVRARFPGHVLDVSEIDDDVAFNMIRSGDIDFGISSVFVPSPGLSFEPLHQDGACVVVSAENDLARVPAISDEALLSQPIVRFPIGTTSDQWLSIILERNQARPMVVAEVRQLLTGLQMVRLNLGVALMPEDAARACSLPGLVIVPLADRRMTRTLGLVRSDAHHPTALETALLDVLASART